MKVERPNTEIPVIITLTEKEASFLWSLLAHVAEGNHPALVFYYELWEALEKKGVQSAPLFFDGGILHVLDG